MLYTKFGVSGTKIGRDICSVRKEGGGSDEGGKDSIPSDIPIKHRVMIDDAVTLRYTCCVGQGANRTHTVRLAFAFESLPAYSLRSSFPVIVDHPPIQGGGGSLAQYNTNNIWDPVRILYCQLRVDAPADCFLEVPGGARESW